MYNAADLKQLRSNGMSNRQILEMMAPIVPSAQRALQAIQNDKITPEWQVDAKIGKMLDAGTPVNAPSGLRAMTAMGLNTAQEKFDNTSKNIEEIDQKSKPGFFGTLLDYASAPVRASAGVLESGINMIAGKDIFGPQTAAATVKEDIPKAGATMAFMAPFAGPIAGMAAAPAYAGALAGPMATGFNTAIGMGLNSLSQEVVGQEKPSIARDIIAPIGGGLVAGTLDYGIGKATQGIKGAIASRSAAKTAESSDDVIQKLVQPKVTAKTVQEVGASNPELVQRGGIFKSQTSLLPSKGEQQLAQTAKTIPGFGLTDDVVQNAQIVHANIGAESKALRNALQSSNAALPRKEIISSVEKAVLQASDDFGDQPGVFQSVIEMARKVTKSHPGNVVGAWDGRIAFDDEIVQRFGTKVFEKGSARSVAIRAARQAWNNTIESAAQKSGNSFAPQIARLSDQYAILENLASKMGTDTLRSTVANFLRTPIGRYVGLGALGAAGYGVAHNL